MNSEMDERIPFADKHSPPRMIPDCVKKEQNTTLIRLAEGSVP